MGIGLRIIVTIDACDERPGSSREVYLRRFHHGAGKAFAAMGTLYERLRLGLLWNPEATKKLSIPFRSLDEDGAGALSRHAGYLRNRHHAALQAVVLEELKPGSMRSFFKHGQEVLDLVDDLHDLFVEVAGERAALILDFPAFSFEWDPPP